MHFLHLGTDPGPNVDAHQQPDLLAVKSPNFGTEWSSDLEPKQSSFGKPKSGTESGTIPIAHHHSISGKGGPDLRGELMPHACESRG